MCITNNNVVFPGGWYGSSSQTKTNPTCTATQYVKVFLEDVALYGQPYMSGVILRGAVNFSSYYKVIFDQENNTVTWFDPSGDVQSGSITVGTTDSFGITVEGSGDSTVVRIWRNPTGNSPSTVSNWGGAADKTFSNNPTTPCDSGRYAGIIMTQKASVHYFYGGDVP